MTILPSPDNARPILPYEPSRRGWPRLRSRSSAQLLHQSKHVLGVPAAYEFPVGDPLQGAGHHSHIVQNYGTFK